MKQVNMFSEDEFSEKKESQYTSKIVTPIYEPKNKNPHPLELYDATKTNRMISEIKSFSLPSDVEKFLIFAATRHTVFNYSKIADFYAHASKDVQNLMEKSALVIIDFDKAIQLGYIQLSKEISSLYLEEYGTAEE